jgi:hypothetical protein
LGLLVAKHTAAVDVREVIPNRLRYVHKKWCNQTKYYFSRFAKWRELGKLSYGIILRIDKRQTNKMVSSQNCCMPFFCATRRCLTAPNRADDHRTTCCSFCESLAECHFLFTISRNCCMLNTAMRSKNIRLMRDFNPTY